jgi:hypothetical protein
VICGFLPVARADEKPVAAVFPVGGDGDAATRERLATSIRAKLDRLGTFRVIDRYTMADLVGDHAIDASTDDRTLLAIAGSESPTLLIWGELVGTTFTARVLDRRDPAAAPVPFERAIERPTDVRFAVEQLLESIAGVEAFAHPSEAPLQEDAAAQAAWLANPNLQPDGSFDRVGGWRAILRGEKYPPPFGQGLPQMDRVTIDPDETGNPRLAIRMSLPVAESNGIAVLGDAIAIEPHTRYRLSFRYRSDGPRARVFVKGYTTAGDLRQQQVEREVYRRQVPVVDHTDGKWETVTIDLNPQHVRFAVQTLRVDLYVHLSAGLAEFDDVVLKKVGTPTRQAKDAAIDPPVTRPAR